VLVLLMRGILSKHSAHRYGSIYQGKYFQHNYFTLMHIKIHEVADWHFQHRFSANMRCGVLGNNLTELYITDEHSTALY
jgi:hypothetical protein